jgi:hypothetical protein
MEQARIFAEYQRSCHDQGRDQREEKSTKQLGLLPRLRGQLIRVPGSFAPSRKSLLGHSR